MKGQKRQWANPELNVGNCQSAYIVLYEIAKVFFFKYEICTAHETHFKHIFKIQGAKSTFVG